MFLSNLYGEYWEINERKRSNALENCITSYIIDNYDTQYSDFKIHYN